MAKVHLHILWSDQHQYITYVEKILYNEYSLYYIIMNMGKWKSFLIMPFNNLISIDALYEAI